MAPPEENVLCPPMLQLPDSVPIAPSCPPTAFPPLPPFPATQLILARAAWLGIMNAKASPERRIAPTRISRCQKVREIRLCLSVIDCLLLTLLSPLFLLVFVAQPSPITPTLKRCSFPHTFF